MRFSKHLWKDPGQEHLWTMSFIYCCLCLNLNYAQCMGGLHMEDLKAHREKI